MEPAQIVTFTFFQYRRPRQQWWALRQMREVHRHLPGVPGLVFYKMLGSGGGNGFSIIPDFSTYALLGVWQDSQHVSRFFSEHPYYQKLKQRSARQWTLHMKAIKVKGRWSGQQPFQVHRDVYADGPVAVLTRATIHPDKLISFWKHVPKVSRSLYQAQQGLLFSKGIGEYPFWQQATFSLWQTRQAMTDYAYQSGSHREIITKARQLQWYQEELFAEFVPVSIFHMPNSKWEITNLDSLDFKY